MKNNNISEKYIVLIYILYDHCYRSSVECVFLVNTFYGGIQLFCRGMWLSKQSKNAGTGRLWLWVHGQLGWQGVNVVFSLKQQAPDDISLVGSENGL